LLRIGFPFRIFFLFRETRNKAKQKICFAKFCLFRETIKTAKFRFISSELNFVSFCNFFSCFVSWIPITFVKFHIFSCFAFLSQCTNCCCILMFNSKILWKWAKKAIPKATYCKILGLPVGLGWISQEFFFHWIWPWWVSK
jgi:hypothetical protein